MRRGVLFMPILTDKGMSQDELTNFRTTRNALGAALCQLMREHVHQVLTEHFNSGDHPKIKLGDNFIGGLGTYWTAGPDFEGTETTSLGWYRHGNPISVYMDLKIKPYAYEEGMFGLGHLQKNKYQWTSYARISVNDLETDRPSYRYQFWNKKKGVQYREGVLNVMEPEGWAPYDEENYNQPEKAKWKTWRDLFRMNMPNWFGKGRLKQNDGSGWKDGPAGATIQTLLIDCVRNLIDTEIKGSDDPHGEHRGDMHWQNRMAWEALGRLVQMLEKNQI